MIIAICANNFVNTFVLNTQERTIWTFQTFSVILHVQNYSILTWNRICCFCADGFCPEGFFRGDCQGTSGWRVYAHVGIPASL